MSDTGKSTKESTHSSDIEKVWKVFRKANKTQREKLLEQLDEDTITELRARGNPYKENALYKRKKGDRILLFSLFSPHEKYIERFAMTSLIGFLFRMLDEWTPEEARQYKSEMDPDFVKAYEKVSKQFMMEKPTQVLEMEEKAITEKLSEIVEALDAKSNPKPKPEGDDLSDDENDETDKRIEDLKLQQTELQMQLVETRAKKTAIAIDVLQQHIEGHKPLLKSLTADVDRQKDVRMSIKKTLRDLLAEKEKLGPQIAQSETPTTVEKPNVRSIEPLTKKQESYNTVVEKIKINKAKFANSTTVVAEAMSKLAAHQAVIDELTSRLNIQKGVMEDLQKNYYEKYIKGTSREVKPKKDKKDKSSRPVKGVKRKTKKTVETAPHLSAFSHLKMNDMDLTPEDEFHLKEMVKSQLGITKTQEECSDVILDNIEEFLYEYLVFNPDNHVKCAYKPNYKDPTRTPLKIDPKSGMILDEQFERKLIPPIDTFKRWERYREAHYEELRQATDDIYCEKSDFEWAIAPLEMFEGENAKEKAEEWQRKHSKEVDFSIRSCYFNVVGLLGPWEQNRDAQNFYTKDTEVLKRMMDTHMEEERFASQMTKERMKKKKAENIAEVGGDEGLDEFLSTNPSGLEKYGAKRSLAAKDIPRDDHDLADDEVQIEVVELGAKRVGRRWKATSEKWKFHVPAEPLEEGQLVTKSAAAFQKELEAKENAEQ